MSEQATVTPMEPVVQMPPFGMDFRQWFEYKAKLATKKSAVMVAVNTIPKNGYNEEHGYAFAKDADINDGLRQLLHDNKLDFDVEFIDRVYRDNGRIVEVKLLMTWTDCETGYFESRKWLAAGFDTVDKGVYKAYTGGGKYFLMRTFLMSQGDTDPEYTARKGKQPEIDPTPPDDLPVRQVDDDPKPATTTKTTGGNRNRKSTEEKTKDTPPADENKAATEPQDVGQANGADEAKEAGEGQQSAAEQDPAGAGKITSEQVGTFKLKLITLAAFAEDKNKKAAQEAVFESLAIKKELRDWGARVKNVKIYDDRIEGLTEQEAAKAIEYMSAWVEQKEKTRGGKTNA